MNVLQIIMAVCLIIASLLIIVLVSMQEGGQGLDSNFGGGSETFLSAGGNKGLPAYRLARATKFAAIAFFGLALVIGIVNIIF